MGLRGDFSKFNKNHSIKYMARLTVKDQQGLDTNNFSQLVIGQGFICNHYRYIKTHDGAAFNLDQCCINSFSASAIVYPREVEVVFK
jgi:hypothetical protein